MPELPEVETIRRALEPVVVGTTIRQLTIDDALWSAPAPPNALEDALVGQTVAEFGRRGKYLILTTTDERHLIMHLRMTGTLLVDPEPDVRFTRVRFRFNDHEVRFCDPRRFGTGLLLLGDAARDAYLDERLGIEPLVPDALDGAVMMALTRGKRTPIKAFLLDQRKIAGVGNIYADEALFSAGIHPTRLAGTLTRKQCDALAVEVRGALQRGLAAGGATIDDFRHPDGVSGTFQHDFRIHLRKDEPCITCGRRVKKMVVAGRGTYVCETCQTKPRVRR